MQITPYKEIEKSKICSTCKKVKPVCKCPKRAEGLKG